MKNKSQQRIWITGGASGLGEALAKRYAREGWAVAFGDVHRARGNALESALLNLGHKAKFIPCDVTRDSDVQAAAEWLEKTWGGVDIVVNNAGVAGAGSIDAITMEDWQWIVDINLLGVVRGCKFFVPILRKQGHGHIINIASAAGFVHMPRMASYNATKAAVIALSETLALELAADKIDISVVCPTFFKTNLVESLRSADPLAHADAARLVTESLVSADVIANSIFLQAARRRFMILPDGQARLARALKRLLPFSLYIRALRSAEDRVVKNLGSSIKS